MVKNAFVASFMPRCYFIRILYVPRFFAAALGMSLTSSSRFRTWAGRVVGGDEVDDAAAQGLPELFAIGGTADGWSTLEERCAVGDVFGGDVQEVGASLDGDGKACVLCGS